MIRAALLRLLTRGKIRTGPAYVIENHDGLATIRPACRVYCNRHVSADAGRNGALTR